jgi:hypothetical protein
MQWAERIAHLLGNGCTKGTQESVVSYFRQWMNMTSGFGTFFGMARTHNDINVL